MEGEEIFKLNQRANVLKVTVSELETLAKDARVYEKQPNSNIFFRQSKLTALSLAKKDLASVEKKLAVND